jgi:serine/threonine protein kinase
MAWIEGEKVGSYILGEQIGQGGMATVYKGYHAQLDREVAIKVMHQNFLDDETFVARFKREAQIVAKLSHPHIVPVYDFDEHQGQPYLVMKYVEGFTLKKQLIKKPLTLDDILDVMSAVGSALAYAHREGVLHRDIKPSNIVIDKEGNPYLTDFGLARLAASGESTMSADMLLGTPHYISPEQAKGMKNLDGRADIYSLGVVLYELLVGHVPYTGDTPYSIIHDHIYTPLPMPSQINPDIPLAVEMVLYKAMEKNPDDRYATADAMIRDLRDAVEEASFTELDPNRASIAAVSLAKAREEMEQQLAQSAPPSAVMSPLPTPTPNLRSATLYSEKPKRWYQEERVWPVGGCASLLLIAFMSIRVLLGMSNNILELAALSDSGSGIVINHDIPLHIPNEYQQFGVELNIDPYTYLSIPYVASDALPDNTDSPFAYLLQARSLYENGQITEARQMLLEGSGTTPELSLYFGSVARLAFDANDRDGAIFFALATLEVAHVEDLEYFAEVRPTLGAFLYETLPSVEIVNLSRMIADMNLSNYVKRETIQSFANSDSLSFALIRNYVANENSRLAARRLETVPEDNMLRPEIDLLRGELARLQGDSDAARGYWQGIIEMEDVPQWVIDRAEVLLNQNN